MKKKNIILGLAFSSVMLMSSCKDSAVQIEPAKNMKTSKILQFPKIVNADIPGAPVLGQPLHIQGKTEEIVIGKHGLAFPTMYDWNKDGKLDLLVGEFETGEKDSFIRIFLNEGSNSAPRYSGEYEYAKDTKGDTITAYYW